MIDDSERSTRAREAEAIGWHLRVHAGDAASAERRAFTSWREEPGNRLAYAEIDRLWSSFGPILMNEGVDKGTVVPLRPRRRIAPSIARGWMAIAASLLVAVGTGYQYLHVWQHDYVTEGSDRGAAVLADGTRIALDTGTAIDVDYTGKVRAVTLVRGRAYFDVRHQSARPFVIDAGGGEVAVLGTAFSVSREGGGGRVVVARGRVRVRAGANSVEITPNQSVRFGGGHDGPVTPVDAATDLGWSQGRLFFRKQTIGEVVAALDRYYPGFVVLTDRTAARRRITATVNLNDIDNWFAALGRSQHLTVRKLPGLLLLS